MTSPAGAFFEQKREWSRRKHEVLEGYLAPFWRIVGRDGKPVYVVDGFAGRGEFGEGREREDGSPRLAAKIAYELADTGRYSPFCINVEADVAEYERLVAVTRPYADRVENLRGPFADHVDGTLARIGMRPSMFFLDPFGPGGLEWTTLEKIGRRPKHLKTEILINVNAPKVDRHAGWLDSFGQKPRPAFLRLLDRIFGCEDWQLLWEQPAPSEVRYQRITAFYLKRVHEVFGFGGAVYPVRTVETGQLKYHMLFFTRHPLGLRIMNSIMYGVEERYLKDRAHFLGRFARQMDMFAEPEPDIEEVEAQAVRELEHDILALGRRRITMTFGGVQDELLHKWFGRMVEKHFRQACARLIDQGHIDRKDSRGITDKTILEFR